MAQEIEIKFESKNLIQAAKLYQQITSQFKLLGYSLDKIVSLPISDTKFETTLTLVYQKKEPKKKP